MGVKNISLILFIFFFKISNAFGDQLVKTKEGDFYILKKDGTFEKLPKPKDGFTYKIKKKKVSNKLKKNLFKRVEKKGRKKNTHSIK
tara:strand:+ start:359 stop:619 length:261 start_codon:yes stop_codon:yes gene_type:complete